MGELTGQLVGQYEIGEEIGRGGRGIVYRAWQESIGRDVAIKFLPREFTHNPNFVSRFEREISTVANIQHANILEIFDSGVHEDQPYIVMSYMGGGTLADRGQSDPPLSLDEAAKLIEQIADGLDYLHKKGIIHRDIKASNVLLDDQGNAQIADFGFVKVQEATAQLTGTGSMVGTHSHMAPELFTDGEATALSDIYALGVTLFYMLSGESPFRADEAIQYMTAHLSERVPALSKLRSDLPRDVQTVIEIAMSKTPENRFQTAGEMAQMLRDVAKGKRFNNRPTWLIPVAVVAAITVIGLVTAFATGLIGGQPRVSDAELTTTSQAIALANATDTPSPTLSPTIMPSDTPIPTATATSTEIPTAIPITTIGGGTGIIGFNRNGLAFTLDVSCVLAEGRACNSNPSPLPAIGGEIPYFYELISGSNETQLIGLWSPDGQSITYDIIAGRTQSDFRVRLANLLTGELFTIQGTQSDWSSKPAWSPDGSQIAFASALGGGVTQIWVADVACLNAGSTDLTNGNINCSRQITKESLPAWDPSWTPDGQRIIFSQHNLGNQLFIINIEGMLNRTQLNPLSPTSNDLQWRSNSDYLYIESSTAVGGDITHLLNYVPDYATLQQPQRVLTLVDNVLAGGWLTMTATFKLSPNGEYAIVNFNTEGIEDTELYLLDLSCLQELSDDLFACEDRERYFHRVTVNDTDDNFPTWSPDGNWIVFLRSDGSVLSNDVLADGVRRNTTGEAYIFNVQEILSLPTPEEREAALIPLTSINLDFSGIQWQPSIIDD